MTLTEQALATDAANFALGNEAFELLGATFVRNREAPDIWDANHIAGARPKTPAEIEAFLAAVDREYSDSSHRRFDVDYRTPPEFVARLALEGYECDDGLLLVLEGSLLGPTPEEYDIRPVDTEADWEAFWDLQLMDWREIHRRLKRKATDRIGRQRFEVKKRKQPPVHNFLAYVKEKPVAYFNSWAGVDGVGQVEDLFTHPKFRNKGIARALIHHCVADARATGAGPIVIASDPSDTPKRLYAAMGFRPVAVASHYIKHLDR